MLEEPWNVLSLILAFQGLLEVDSIQAAVV